MVQVCKASALAVLVCVSWCFLIRSPTRKCLCADQSPPEEGVGSQEGQPVAIDFYFRFGWENDPIPLSFEN